MIDRSAEVKEFSERLTAAIAHIRLPTPIFPSDRYALWKESKNRSNWPYEEESIDTLRRMQKCASEECDAQRGQGKYAAMVWTGLRKINDEIGVRNEHL